MRFEQTTLGREMIGKQFGGPGFAFMSSSGSTLNTTAQTMLNESPDGVHYLMRGRNQAVLIAYPLISTAQAPADAFGTQVSLQVNLIDAIPTNANIDPFCNSFFNSTFTLNERSEPLYEVVVGATTFGIYYRITDCRSSTSATSKVRRRCKLRLQSSF